ncbi:MAG TPA: KamA family radical SAM protein [Candidatus Polarisedimenticolia bacterium]|nr:KamA family radical SAM protein [Candidatus Polarisedimenticolia bacterium]
METDSSNPQLPQPQIDPKNWNDWRWQMRNRLASIEDLQKYIRLTPSEINGIKMAQGRFPVAVTPYWASLLDPSNPRCPLRMQVIPTAQEHLVSRHEMLDPLAEDSHSPVPGIVHRYPDRVLLLPLNMCAAYCRYCTRSRWVGDENEMMFGPRLDAAIEYLRRTKEVRDVLISGGDPLLFSDKRLDELLSRLRAIDHIEFIRIGTRVPVFLPMRITDELVQTMRKYHPLWLSIHFNHPAEITPEVKKACSMLADGGFPLGSQSVLLKGINDDPAVFKRLVHELLKIRVRPYYVYQCDPVTGTTHFRTPVSRGVEIIESLRGHTTGYAVPTFVVDAPGGGGKVPVSPNYVLEHSGNVLTLRNYAGRRYTYHEEPQ